MKTEQLHVKVPAGKSTLPIQIVALDDTFNQRLTVTENPMLFPDAKSEALERARYYVEAINHHPALLAVVEAAKIAEFEMGSCFRTGCTLTPAQCVTLYGILNTALAKLTTK